MRAVLASGLLLAALAAAGGDAAALAQRHCAACHLLPDPALATRALWHDEILPRMKMRLGFSTPELERSPNVRLLRAHGRIPREPALTEAEWLAIAGHYLGNAPETLPPVSPRLPVVVDPGGWFAVEPAAWRQPVPAVTLVRISPERRGVWVGDEPRGGLVLLDDAGRFAVSLRVGGAPASLVEHHGVLTLGLMGSFPPADLTNAAVLQLAAAGPRWTAAALLEGLPRLAYALPADLNGDGRADLVASLFGNQVGRFSWFEAQAAGGFREHRLLDVPGAVRADVRDFNGDGRPDLAVLVAQESETLWIFASQPGGEFTPHRVFQRDPIFGHSSFETVDFDGDGRLDFLVTNGDSGEYPAPVKPYHGVRLYRNRGGLAFEESLFLPLPGAYAARARDFDGDGDLDIAAIAYFADYARTPEEGFVLFENLGGGAFRKVLFPEARDGRWLVMDVGDVDGDGDEDLVLGAYARGPTPATPALQRRWEEAGPSVLLLRNLARRPAASR